MAKKMTGMVEPIKANSFLASGMQQQIARKAKKYKATKIPKR